jgi:hypothetical protein
VVDFAKTMISPGDPQGPDFAVYLDYGIDCYFGNCGDLIINERGFILRSRWCFPLGTQLAIRVCAHPLQADECAICEDVTGMVVSCERVPDTHGFEVTILFLDISEPTQEELNRVAGRLELIG